MFNKKLLKDKKVIIGIVIAVVVAALGLKTFLGGSSESLPTPEQVIEEIPAIDPEELGLGITVKPDNKYVKFLISNIKDVKHIEWEFSYDADIPLSDREDGADPNQKVTQQFGGEAEIDSSDSSYESVYRELGTCSTGGKCRFDTGIEKVDLVIKITKSDGKIFQSSISKTLE